jgi:Recombination endonuclease VII
MPSLSKLYTKKEIDNIRDGLIAKHGDHCAMCKKPGSAFSKKLSVDHNHKTNAIRGLLCYRCNRFILGRHTVQTAKQILEYLEKYEG